MAKILVAPDKFKGSLSGQEVADCIARGIHRYNAGIEVIKHPLADGGEGTLEALSGYMKMEQVALEVTGPLFARVQANYMRSRTKAWIELAEASGLPLLTVNERDVMETTTLGTGELMAHAISQGAKELFLFIGGSATNDAAMGIGHALGYRFLDDSNVTLRPVGKNLSLVRSIEASSLAFDLTDLQVNVICDVKNPMHGIEGAAYMYGPQKGASEDQVTLLDAGLVSFSKVLKNHFGKDVSNVEGAGAAGGVGGGAIALFNATLIPGIQMVMDVTKLKEKLELVDWVITGEGKLDDQTLHGKVVAGVAGLAKELGVRMAVVCGVKDDNIDFEMELGAKGIAQIKQSSITTEESMKNAAFLLEERTVELLRVLGV